MEKERGSKVIAIIALLIAVVGLSVGFAAYTSSLSISNTSATVGAAAADDFEVIFSTDGTSDDTTIANLLDSAVKDPVADGPSAVLADGASMTGTTISGLSATFTEPGQSVTYTFYAHNTGKFLAYLNSITIGEKSCTAKTGTDQDLVDTVCPSLSMSVKVGKEAATAVSVADVDNHSLAIDGYETITVTLTYDETDARADGDFTVNFGQITLVYDHTDK